MKKTKIILFFTVFFGIGIGGLYYATHPEYYYVKITTEGKLNADSQTSKIYSYSFIGYNKNGEKKNLEVSTHPDLNRPFKKGAYLKINYTNWKKVTGYEEVKSSDIPKKAIDKLE